MSIPLITSYVMGIEWCVCVDDHCSIAMHALFNLLVLCHLILQNLKCLRFDGLSQFKSGMSPTVLLKVA